MARLAPVFRLPPFHVHRTVVRPERVDWAHRLLQIRSLWAETRGAEVLVGVIDSGVAVAHPDLAPVMADSRDFTGSITGVGDDLGHGTHVAGIIAAADNGQGVVGVAPDARILNAKVMRTPDDPIDEARVAEAVAWCVASDAHLINISLASTSPTPELHDAIVAAVHAGVQVICAAGNLGPDDDSVGYPARYEETIAVGYVRWSQRGPMVARDSARGEQLDLVAPGAGILSTYPPSVYAVSSGSSMAAPFATGVAALLVAKRYAAGQRPIDNPYSLRRLLSWGATDLYGPGKDDFSGYGLIRPEAVLSQAGTD